MTFRPWTPAGMRKGKGSATPEKAEIGKHFFTLSEQDTKVTK